MNHSFKTDMVTYEFWKVQGRESLHYRPQWGFCAEKTNHCLPDPFTLPQSTHTHTPWILFTSEEVSFLNKTAVLKFRGGIQRGLFGGWVGMRKTSPANSYIFFWVRGLIFPKVTVRLWGSGGAERAGWPFKCCMASGSRENILTKTCLCGLVETGHTQGTRERSSGLPAQLIPRAF